MHLVVRFKGNIHIGEHFRKIISNRGRIGKGKIKSTNVLRCALLQQIASEASPAFLSFSEDGGS